MRPAFRLEACLALAALLQPAILHAQEIRLTGRVLERADLKPVPGALVRLRDKPDIWGTTGADGKFSIIRSVTSLAPQSPVAHDGRTPGLGPFADAENDPPARNLRDAQGRLLAAARPNGQGAGVRLLAPWKWTFPSPASDAASAAVSATAAGKSSATAVDRLDIICPGLAGKTLDLGDYRQELGDVVLEYPARVLGVGAPPVYGAIALFDGDHGILDAEWQHWMGTYRVSNGLGPTPITWLYVEDPVDAGMTMRTCCRPQWGDEDLVTKRKFKDFQLHLEFNLVSAPRVGGSNPGPANSGVYLQSFYEIQIKDDYGVSALGNHDAASILNEVAAPRNLSAPRGQWQAYDITFRAARFKEGVRTEKARLTLYWNGILVHEDKETANEHGIGISSDALADEAKGLKLQSEGHDVRFRNIWIKELQLTAADTRVGY